MAPLAHLTPTKAPLLVRKGVDQSSWCRSCEAGLTGQDQDLDELEQVGAFTLVLGSAGFAGALGFVSESFGAVLSSDAVVLSLHPVGGHN